MKLTVRDLKATRDAAKQLSDGGTGAWYSCNWVKGLCQNMLDTVEYYEHEVAKLRESQPPPPKFRVGQVVTTTLGNYPRPVKLCSFYWDSVGDPAHPHYIYTTHANDRIAEFWLRTLTDDEK